MAEKVPRLIFPWQFFLKMDAKMEKIIEPTLRQASNSSSGYSNDVAFDEKATKRLVRKIDIVLLPLLSLLYLYVCIVLFYFVFV